MKLEKILVPTDFSEFAKRALEQAIGLAAEHDAEICLLHVVTLYGEDPNHPDSHFPEVEAAFRRLERQAAQDLSEWVAEYRNRGRRIWQESIRAIAPAPAIVAFAESFGADLVIMGTHGRRGARRLLLGSVAEEVTRLGTCGVLTTGKQPESRIFRKIMVPYDFSDYSDQALATAVDLAKSHDGAVDMVHVVAPPVSTSAIAGIPAPGLNVEDLTRNLEDLLKDRAQDIKAESGVDVGYRVLQGYTEQALTDYAKKEDVDVIVMGSHGLTGLWRFLLGSVTEKVVRIAECPVWITRLSRPTGDQAAGEGEGLAEAV